MNANPHLVSGRSNAAPITSRGAQQAVLFAEAFQSGYPSPTTVYSSPAVRTLALAQTYATKAGFSEPIRVDDALQEMTQGDADGQLRADIYTEEVIERIATELFDFKLPNGESLNDVSTRLVTWIHQAAARHPNEILLVSSHGQAIRAVVGSLLGWSHYDVTRNPETTTPNVSLTHLSVNDKTIQVHFVNKVIIDPSRLRENGVY